MKRMRTHRLRMQFDWWIARMAPPECHVASIRSLQNRVSAQVGEIFQLEADGSFSFDVLTMTVN